MDDNDNDNVFQFGSVKGGKSPGDKDDGIPTNDYVIVDNDGNEFFAAGFVIFTPHHLAIMRDQGQGPVPVLVMPIGNVRVCELYEDDDEQQDLL